jgi:hypothetical protein
MKSYSLKLSGREDGPYEEAQIAQMFADGLIDRNTPCKPADRGDWKTIDDYLPMLKYGTQLPPPVEIPRVPPMPPPVLLSQRVSVVDFDIPFWSVEDHVQVDGGSIRCLLLLFAGDHCHLADPCGGIRRDN